MANFEVTRDVAIKLCNEFNFQGLFMYHTPLGPNANQTTIVDNNGPLGATNVNNWTVFDGPGPDATVIARAQGLHIQAGNWLNAFSLVFEEESRFSGSTLQVMGITVETGEWAIVGGTGQFAMASGVISKRFHEQRSDGNIIELNVHAFCPVLDGSRYPVIRLGPWGGEGGSAQFITETPKHLESITIHSGAVVDSIEFSYIDHSGQKHSSGRWGGPGGNPHTINLAQNEFLTEISGTVGSFNGLTVITSITLVSNIEDTHGPFGEVKGTPFSVPLLNGSGVVGFFASTGQFLDSFGVEVRPPQ
ncbi:hypothetical protein QOZ80_7AG0563270 [Eleusine coracana subsp. coracana]|nr:hypothetical protein QOZ80_7AG0563270 [Eleusine coracana subsp. coracana]